MAECIYHITYSKEILDAALKFRIGQTAVRHVGERNTKTAQHFSSCKQAALAVAETHTVLIRSLIARSPEEYRKPHFLCQSCTDILGSEITMREHQTVHALFFKFLRDLLHILIVI